VLSFSRSHIQGEWFIGSPNSLSYRLKEHLHSHSWKSKEGREQHSAPYVDHYPLKDVKMMSGGPNDTWLTLQYPTLQTKEGTAWFIRILPTSLATDILKISRDLLGMILIIGWAYTQKGRNLDKLRIK